MCVVRSITWICPCKLVLSALNKRPTWTGFYSDFCRVQVFFLPLSPNDFLSIGLYCCSCCSFTWSLNSQWAYLSTDCVNVLCLTGLQGGFSLWSEQRPVPAHIYFFISCIYYLLFSCSLFVWNNCFCTWFTSNRKVNVFCLLYFAFHNFLWFCDWVNSLFCSSLTMQNVLNLLYEP